MPTYEPTVFSHAAGKTRRFIDQHLVYSVLPDNLLNLDRYHTFRAQNAEMHQIYSIEHHLLELDPIAAIEPLEKQAYPGLTTVQMKRLLLYIKQTINQLPDYDRVQNYYFLHAAPEDKLDNRPQMSRNGVAYNGTIVRGYRREDLVRGGLLS